MASICEHCALRLLTAARSTSRISARRNFSSTVKKHKGGVPAFTQTSQPQLDDVLASLRDKYFIPAYLSKSERRMIFGTKYRQSLEDNPQTVTIGKEDIDLKWIDRRRDIPKKSRLLRDAINFMAKGDSKDWRNLPALLEGLKRVDKVVPTNGQMAKIVRLAVRTGHLSIILMCLQKAATTGMSLKDPEVRQHVIWGLREIAQQDEWSEAATSKALKESSVVALLLESEEHGYRAASQWSRKDSRKDPHILGVFLELAAVYAYRHQSAKDSDGKVRAYAERLLSCIDFHKGKHERLPNHEPRTLGPQDEILDGLPIWHGLKLAQKILGEKIPQPTRTANIVNDYEAALTNLAETLKASNPKKGSYDEQAVMAWEKCRLD